MLKKMTRQIKIQNLIFTVSLVFGKNFLSTKQYKYPRPHASSTQYFFSHLLCRLSFFLEEDYFNLLSLWKLQNYFSYSPKIKTMEKSLYSKVKEWGEIM